VDLDRDVIVIGAGSAGLCAGVAAAAAGARRVLVLEKGGADEAGGNARLSHVGFRAPYTPESLQPFLDGMDLDPERRARLVLPGHTPAEFAADLDASTNGRMDPAIRDRFAERAAPTQEWMRRLGIPWTLNRTVAGPGGEHFEPGLVLAAGAGGGGKEVVDAWIALGAQHGMEVWFDAPVADIRLGGASGHTVTIGGEGALAGTTLTARTIIAAAGGFQADPARRVHYLGEAYEDVLVRGTLNDTGEVLDLLLREGAAGDGSFDQAVVTPVDADSPPTGGGNDMNRYSYPWGISVDRQGRRFFDEGAGRMADTYGGVGRFIVERAGGLAFQVFDATGIRHIKKYAYVFAKEHRADTIRALAEAAGIDPDGLEAEVAAFNAAVVDGRPFEPTELDGRHTQGIEPPKSNWATRIETPPFYAYAVTGGITFSLGGLKIDPDARVLGRDGTPVPGLFATGDILGIFHGDYPSGAGQTRNVVFGRLAGEGAAAYVARE
jgi:tricarballylate dehydrogenase